MQDRPGKEVLLKAVARFLDKEVKGALTDPRLAFRVLIAANLTTIVAAEGSNDEEQDHAELGRLQTLLPGIVSSEHVTTRATRHAAITALNRELASRIRAGFPQSEMPALKRHLQQTLREKLAVTNPRFDLRSDIE